MPAKSDQDMSQPELFPSSVLLHRIDEVRNMRRYYMMTIQPDLFGGATLIREWGRIGHPGQIQMSQHKDEGQAVDVLAHIAKAKQKRGYQST